MKKDIEPDTPLSVILHLYPESESILKSFFKKTDLSSMSQKVKTLEVIANEENIDLDKVLGDLRDKLNE